MKNKIIVAVLCLVVCLCMFAGCAVKGAKNYATNANLIKINNELYYYQPTRVVYIVFNEKAGYKGYGYMAPYYNGDGKLCQYDLATRSIIEIEN